MHTDVRRPAGRTRPVDDGPARKDEIEVRLTSQGPHGERQDRDGAESALYREPAGAAKMERRLHVQDESIVISCVHAHPGNRVTACRSGS